MYKTYTSKDLLHVHTYLCVLDMLVYAIILISNRFHMHIYLI